MKKLVFLTFIAIGQLPLLPCPAQVGIGIGTGGIGVGLNLGSNRNRAARSPESEVRYLKRELDLSTSQEAATREAVRERENYRSRKDRQENYERFDVDMKDILTPEQYAKYLEIRQESRSSRARSKEKKEKKEVPKEEWDDVYR